ncbi:MAG: ATP-binding protein [Burkholderiales bacterium]|nr:ATP-binding protein [Burkholderiales bacterium]
MKTSADHPDTELVNMFTGTANREGLTHCMALSETICGQLNLGAEDAYAIRLAVEEACTNIVNHGYAGTEPGPMQLAFKLRQADDARQVIIELQDAATPFHPEDAKAPDVLSDAEDRAVGGLGWFFIQSTMDEVHYRSEGGNNCLTLTRTLTAPVAPSGGGTA